MPTVIVIALDWILSLFELTPTNLHLELLEEDRRLLLGKLQLVRLHCFRPNRTYVTFCFLINVLVRLCRSGSMRPCFATGSLTEQLHSNDNFLRCHLSALDSG